jgi:hypothetical protein
MVSDSKYFMLDTNVFNRVCDGVLPFDCLRGRRIMATGIQQAELSKTSAEARRIALLDTFEIIQPYWVPTAQFVLDMPGAGFDQGCFGLNDGTHEAMLARLRELDRKNDKWINQVGDVLIAETAMRRGAVLVSGDMNLRTMASEFGVEVMPIEEFAQHA